MGFRKDDQPAVKEGVSRRVIIIVTGNSQVAKGFTTSYKEGLINQSPKNNTVSFLKLIAL